MAIAVGAGSRAMGPDGTKTTNGATTGEIGGGKKVVAIV
jgi:hypothetical protein